ncbi:hypothetical protein BDB00DRAFT_821256 [Zychaea mexicana]|uniref:uncharacterized protein n=1 Tax=Zychaea mexicana TaxID=64656 RepID=UPI0022FE0513|nr:uncharacterized protein BDB00DRAFT_821256 [Zychaea mexicana]KAI9493922.1 hypothetical protein BDB00DRAFT_821256 [Zychaea mexicana]
MREWPLLPVHHRDCLHLLLLTTRASPPCPISTGMTVRLSHLLAIGHTIHVTRLQHHRLLLLLLILLILLLLRRRRPCRILRLCYLLLFRTCMLAQTITINARIILLILLLQRQYRHLPHHQHIHNK